MAAGANNWERSFPAAALQRSWGFHQQSIMVLGDTFFQLGVPLLPVSQAAKLRSGTLQLALLQEGCGKALHLTTALKRDTAKCCQRHCCGTASCMLFSFCVNWRNMSFTSYFLHPATMPIGTISVHICTLYTWVAQETMLRSTLHTYREGG